MGRSKRPGATLAEQLADLEDPAPKGVLIDLRDHLSPVPPFVQFMTDSFYLDFDPEDSDLGAPSSDDESASEVDENAGREHYQAVG